MATIACAIAAPLAALILTLAMSRRRVFGLSRAHTTERTGDEETQQGTVSYRGRVQQALGDEGPDAHEDVQRGDHRHDENHERGCSSSHERGLR